MKKNLGETQETGKTGHHREIPGKTQNRLEPSSENTKYMIFVASKFLKIGKP
jgi:hypothetical protein